MDKKRTLKFFKILSDNEQLRKADSPFKYGISKKSTKRIFDFFSIKILNKLEIYPHYTQKSSFFRLKATYLYNKEINTFSLTKETKLNAPRQFLKEYFYLKLIYHILFIKK